MRFALGSAILLIPQHLSPLSHGRLKRPMPLPAVVGRVVLLLFVFGAGPTPSRAAIELGTLTIQSQPDVEVIWEGVPLGATDSLGQMLVANIPPGTYTITFSSPDFATRSESVDVAPGLQRLDATLVEAGSAEATEPVRPIEAAEPAPAGEGGGGAQDLGTSEPQDTITTAAVLVVVAVLVLTAFLFADRRSRHRQIDAKPEGPRIVVRGTSRRAKKLPAFYDDLKRRESDLEDLVDVGSGRSQRQVIDVEIEDHGPVEDDR